MRVVHFCLCLCRERLRPCAKDRIGLAVLTIISREFQRVHLDVVIRHTLKVLTYFSQIDKHTTFEGWLLSYRLAINEYNAIFGNLNHSVIQLANSYLALQALGKRYPGLDSVIKFLQLSWQADTMTDIINDADHIHETLVTQVRRWFLQTTSTLRPNPRYKNREHSSYLMIQDILDLQPAPATLSITAPSEKCPYCLHDGHTLQTCKIRDKDRAIKENLGPVITEVSKVQDLLDKILSNLHRGTLTEQHHRDMKALLHTISDHDRNPIFLAGKRLREWLPDRPSRNRNRSAPHPTPPPPRLGNNSRAQTTRPPQSTANTVVRNNNARQRK